MKKLLIISFFFAVMLSLSKHVNAQELKKDDVVWVFHDTITVNKFLYDRGSIVGYYHDGRWAIKDTMFLINVLLEQYMEQNDKNCPWKTIFITKKQ